jgi:hypothetical protein
LVEGVVRRESGRIRAAEVDLISKAFFKPTGRVGVCDPQLHTEFRPDFARADIFSRVRVAE